MEALLANYDAEPVAALTAALRIALDAATLEWVELLQLANISSHRRRQLLDGEPSALDQLVAELNELRTVERLMP